MGKTMKHGKESANVRENDSHVEWKQINAGIEYSELFNYSFVLNCRGVRISRGVYIFLDFSKVGGS